MQLGCEIRVRQGAALGLGKTSARDTRHAGQGTRFRNRTMTAGYDGKVRNGSKK